jgi:hypothetical protein
MHRISSADPLGSLSKLRVGLFFCREEMISPMLRGIAEERVLHRAMLGGVLAGKLGFLLCTLFSFLVFILLVRADLVGVDFLVDLIILVGRSSRVFWNSTWISSYGRLVREF